MGLNDKHIGKRTQFIRKAGMLSGYIANILDKDQRIKRYLYYNTLMPLAKKSKGYDGKVVEQPDIDFSLIDDDYIINGMFDEDMEQLVKNQLYVHVFKGNRNDDVNATVYIAINILVDKKFEHLVNKWDLRSYQIGDIVEELFNDVYIDKNNTDEEIIKELGNLHFKLISNGGSFTYDRLSKTNSIVLQSIVLTTTLNTLRINKDE